MKRSWDKSEENYFGIGIYRPKTRENVGTLWRTAFVYNASFIFVIEEKYRKRSSDVLKVWSKIPLFQYETADAFFASTPYSCKIIGVEMGKNSTPIASYQHPNRAIYLLGSEDHGLPKEIQKNCHDLIALPGERSLNVAVAGSIVVYDRISK